MIKTRTADPGRSYPLGATVSSEGVNFSVFAKENAGLDLLLFDNADDANPSAIINLDPLVNRTYHYWHVFVHGIGAGQVYAYRVRGPFSPQNRLCFDPEQILLDPYGRCVAKPAGYSREEACKGHIDMARAMKSVVVDVGSYDWENDSPLRIPFVKTILYEMHTGGFTKHPSSGVARERRGTYAGLIDKIPYLVDLGITAVELMPVFAFDEQDGPPGLCNYWGYSPVSFFAPHAGYSSQKDPLGILDEFRDMVKALHKAGIEVILDVVYNHTAEGDYDGPTFCFRGLSNENYYILKEDKCSCANYSGCGNTLNANESICRRLILDSLRYWVSEMHVDGFRFDLASILSRDSQGNPMTTPPILWDIESDPVLANVKLIAEAWDAAGLYQVGSFAGDSWKEWNGQFRDDIRAFIKGDKGMTRRVAYRLLGSPDLYRDDDREPEQSINFITSHDGFTANDLVSYNKKHNEANGEGNRDGSDHNLSWNCGVEGATDDPVVEGLRNRQVKNLLAITLLATGVPMVLMGDEVRRSQGGNNNAYCQDNEVSWFDWALVEKHADIHRFTRLLVSLRLNMDLPAERYFMTLNELLRHEPVDWHGVKLNAPDWGYESHTLAATVRTAEDQFMVHLMINAFWEPLDFEIPHIVELYGPWRRCIDTSLDSPDDICRWEEAPAARGLSYRVQSRSLVLLCIRVA